MLIENDKRGIELQLYYSDEKFAVPSNVYIIGMMNTADRSLAMLDYALRKRFAFIEIKPGFDSEGFKAYKSSIDNIKFDRLEACVENLNKAIADDESLGEGFCIGHSYFCNLNPDAVDDNALSGIIEYELVPLLKEYWFDEAIWIMMAVPFFGVALIRMIGLWNVTEKSGRSFCLKMRRSPSTDKDTSTGMIVFVCGKICLLISCIMPAFLWSKLKNAKNRLTVCLRCLENVSDFLLSELLTLGYS